MHLRCAGQPGRGAAPGKSAPTGVLLEGFCQDVTDQRDAEAALRQAEKLSAIGQLTGGVAHDFNNLLTVVSANLQLALESVADGETRQALEAAAAAAERGAALTSQLLSFARRQPLRPRALALGPFLDGFAGLVSRLLGDTHPLSVTVDPAGLGVECDPAQFESALLNLVLNARDAMPAGGPIRIEAMPDPAGLVAVRVQDCGTGMSPEIMARVLEPFFTTKPPGKGTGLGLSMALGFARQSGGDLRVESALGVGSTMSLLLPRAANAAAGCIRADAATALPAIAVLIVEDDPAVRAVATTIFERFGARVAAVDNGEEALALLREGHPCDLLFSDIVLGPGMDGFALGRAVRAAHPRVAVLFTSGYNEASAECARSPELSGCDLLPKPYAIGPLRAAVLKALAAVR
jgi:CheY-like chemotaxis protein/nitrogen-specific signal transduction histidine kinase